MTAIRNKSEIKFEELCRTCLSKDNVLYSIFDIIKETITLDYIVTSITGLKVNYVCIDFCDSFYANRHLENLYPVLHIDKEINKNDGLPSTICCNCKEKAANAFDFKRKSEEAYLSLQSLLENDKKEWSAPSKTIQNMGVKTEDLSLQENDDYLESDFNLSFNITPELSNLDSVKSEDEVHNNKVFFECGNCLGIFKTQDECLQHQKKKCIKAECDDSNSASCPLCGTMCSGADTLTKHMWTHHADLMGPKRRGRPKKILSTIIRDKMPESGMYTKLLNKMECSYCNQYFKTKEELGTHLITHKDMKVLCCVLCQKKFLERMKFDQHNCMGEKDPSNTDVKKQIKFSSEITLQEFLSANTEMVNVALLQICPTCSCIFLLEKDLTKHCDAEHPELSQRCNLCTKVFASVRSAARHRSICKQIERKYKCTTCSLKFAYEITLNKHILRYHEGESVSVRFIDDKTKRENREFQCDTCNRCFYKRELLVKHTKIHMPNEKYFECDVCEKKFHRRDNLRSHKRIHEVERDKGSSKTLLCLYCGRSFSSSSNLIVHMRRHTGEKPYKCDFCEKGFPRSSDLQCHRRTHTGEKPFICRVCGKGFSRSNKLSRHMRVHTGQRPYKCSYCDKAFSQSNDLTLHIRRHTGDRPYICEVCGDRFIQGTALQNHRRAHGHFPPPPTNTLDCQSLTYTV